MPKIEHDSIAQRLHGRPLLMDPSAARSLYDGLRQRQSGSVELLPGEIRSAEASKLMGFRLQKESNREYPVIDGVAVIPVVGTLYHRWRYSGYMPIERRLLAAVDDPEVKGILLDIDSPGGEVSGCFDLADLIYGLRDEKPIWSLANEMAASAAYALGSSASRLVLTRTSEVGSIGVVMTHADWSKFYSDVGINIEFIFAGAHKVDGNRYQPLPGAVRDRYQGEVDELRDLFVETVARNRGVNTQSIFDTEALLYTGQHAVEAGLADAVMPARDVLVEFSKTLSSSGGPNLGTFNMSTETDKPRAEQPGGTTGSQRAATHTQADVDNAAKTAATEARQRVGAILGCDAANGREAMANELALSDKFSHLSAEQAIALLEAAPKASAEGESQGKTLDEAMAETEQPGVGAEAGDGSEVSDADRIVASFNKGTGRK